MFKRLVALLLVWSILGYGLAVAADLHGELGVDVAATADLPSADDHAGDGCGHCSHGASHLMGLHPHFGLPVPTVRRTAFVTQREPLSHRLQRPLLRPPID